MFMLYSQTRLQLSHRISMHGRMSNGSIIKSNAKDYLIYKIVTQPHERKAIIFVCVAVAVDLLCENALYFLHNVKKNSRTLIIEFSS